MDAWVWIAIAVVVVAAIAVWAWAIARRRRTATLKDRFGPEYDRTLQTEGGRRAAEGELKDRVERRDMLDIRPLPPAAAERYTQEWQQIQAHFVDSPQGALGQADTLITNVMRDRGYPMDDFPQRSADISVDHPGVVADYRAAHDISVANQRGQATTEDLRKAMVHYRTLFEQMVEVDNQRDIPQDAPR
jgi:hypothetical protein